MRLQGLSAIALSTLLATTVCSSSAFACARLTNYTIGVCYSGETCAGYMTVMYAPPPGYNADTVSCPCNLDTPLLVVGSPCGSTAIESQYQNTYKKVSNMAKVAPVVIVPNCSGDGVEVLGM